MQREVHQIVTDCMQRKVTHGTSDNVTQLHMRQGSVTGCTFVIILGACINRTSDIGAC